MSRKSEKNIELNLEEQPPSSLRIHGAKELQLAIQDKVPSFDDLADGLADLVEKQVLSQSEGGWPFHRIIFSLASYLQQEFAQQWLFSRSILLGKDSGRPYAGIESSFLLRSFHYTKVKGHTRYIPRPFPLPYSSIEVNGQTSSLPIQPVVIQKPEESSWLAEDVRKEVEYQAKLQSLQATEVFMDVFGNTPLNDAKEQHCSTCGGGLFTRMKQIRSAWDEASTAQKFCLRCEPHKAASFGIRL